MEARLTSAESVKEFLVEKLKDTELVLKKTIDGANEAARQHHADQEVGANRCIIECIRAAPNARL